MTNQFEAEIFSDPMYEAAMRALVNLSAADSDKTDYLLDGVSGVSKILQHNEEIEFLPTKLEVKYRSEVLGEIDPAIIEADEPPEYLRHFIGSAALALVDFTNMTQHRNGKNQVFAPGKDWLQQKLSEVWFMRSIQGDVVDEIPIIGLGATRYTELVLARHEDKRWALEFVNSYILLNLRNELRYAPGEITEVTTSV